MIGGELLASFIPARGHTIITHNVLAQLMAAGMLGLAFLFWRNLEGWVAIGELGLALCLSGLGVMTFIDKRHFIIHELGFIFLSHFSVVVAALALR